MYTKQEFVGAGVLTAVIFALAALSLLASATPVFAAPTVSTSYCTGLTRMLAFGSRGNDVFALQQFFVSQGLLSSDSLTGYFGPLTQAAVRQWQTQQSIVSSGTAATTGFGVVGPRTRAAIQNSCVSGKMNPVQVTTGQLPTSPSKLDVGSPAPPADQALAELTVVGESDGQWRVRIDKIRDYIAYPYNTNPPSTNPQFRVGDTISIRFNGWLDTFESSSPVCPPGYLKSPKPGQAGSATQPPSVKPQPQITVGKQYLSKLEGCFLQANCQTTGWSGWLYNSSPTVVEYECVQGSTTPPPSVNPQDGYPSVQPQQ